MKTTEDVILEIISELGEQVTENGALKAEATIDLGSASDMELEIYIQVRQKEAKK